MVTANKNPGTEPAPAVEHPLRWSAYAAIAVVIGAYLAASIIGEALFYVIGMAQGWSLQRTENWISEPAVSFATTFVIYALMVGLVYWFIRSRKGSLRLLGVRRPHLKDFGMTLLAVPVYIGAYLLLLSVASALVPGLNTEGQQQLGFTPNGIHPALIATFISLVVLPPLAEEFIMRGFLFTSLLKRFAFPMAALITSVLFAAAHLQIGSGAPLLWVAAIDTFVLSLVLCYLRYKTGALWAGIGLHALKNLVAFSVVFVFPFINGHGHDIMSSSMILHGVHCIIPHLPAF